MDWCTPATEARLDELLRQIQKHASGVPVDATGSELAVGELMWRGLVEPCLSGRQPDVAVGTVKSLRFVLTAHGRAAENARVQRIDPMDDAVALLTTLVALRRKESGGGRA